jgi:molecular chaperone GrpE
VSDEPKVTAAEREPSVAPPVEGESPPPVEAKAPPAEQAVEQDLEELLQRAERERDEYLTLAQRTQADFENYRKRMSREVSMAEGRGLAKLAKELLPAIDALELGLERTDDESLRLVHQQLVAALTRVGIEPYSPEGEPFDPVVHEAMSQIPVEGAEPGTVAEVYQRGYRMDGTILRPAKVVVVA